MSDSELRGVYGSVEKFTQLPLRAESNSSHSATVPSPQRFYAQTHHVSGNPVPLNTSGWRPPTGSRWSVDGQYGRALPERHANIRPSTSFGPSDAYSGPFRKEEIVYKPTTSMASSSVKSRKTYDKLAEVYSDASDTAQFCENLEVFCAEKVPTAIWILLLALQIIAGLISIFIGTLNFPFCEALPLVPVYLIVSGCLLIINGAVRIFNHIPTPRRPKGRLMQHLCMYAVEGLILLAMVVNVILGCVWVYGQRYVHFREGVFEQDYCDWTLYWTAYWSLALHLTAFALTIAAVFVILMYGSLANTTE